jgi:hypothetical protein
LASTISGSTAPKLGFAIISAKLGIAGCMFTGGGGGGFGDGGLAAILAAKPTDGLGCPPLAVTCFNAASATGAAGLRWPPRSLVKSRDGTLALMASTRSGFERSRGSNAGACGCS